MTSAPHAASMTAFDSEYVQGSFDYDDDLNFRWHPRLLLVSLGDLEWVAVRYSLRRYCDGLGGSRPLGCGGAFFWTSALPIMHCVFRWM